MSSPPGTRLMMTTDTVGGTWIFAATLARSLGVTGLQVLLVTLGRRPTAIQRGMIAVCTGVSLIETDLRLEWQDPSGSDLNHANAVLGAIANRFAADIVQLNSFREATFDWKVPTLVVAHSCVNSWAGACRETEAFADEGWSVYTSNVRAGLQSADAWVAPTSAFCDEIARHYGPSAKGHVIWNGVDGAGDTSEPKLPAILAAGRIWDKAKNLSVLASVSPAIDWPVRIAGPSAVEGSGLPPGKTACEFPGELSHEALLAEMQAASIFVSPALYEPFGLSVLEAASAGCSLLLSDIPTFRELWDGAALFFDPRDRQSLISCLRSLCGDDVERRRLQRAAAGRARHYPLRNTVDSYRSLYASLLATASRRSQFIKGAEVLI